MNNTQTTPSFITPTFLQLLIDRSDREEFFLNELRNSVNAMKKLSDQVARLGKKKSSHH